MSHQLKSLPTKRIDQWEMPESTIPRVSVVCWTYNHEHLIRQTIDSILMQEVPFPVELIIHDDASTDGNPEIIRDYQRQHPTLVRPVLQTENQLQQGINFVPGLFDSCRGEYIAICDGDDYWTHSEKLARQVKCLESNAHASGCFHSADDLYDEQLTPDRWRPDTERDEFTLDDLFRTGNPAPTASLMLRKHLVRNVPGTAEETPHGDFVFLMQALKSGPLIFLDESMSVYRRHSQGRHSTTYGSLASIRALKSLIYGAHFLDLQSCDSYLDGVRWRMQELDECTARERGHLRYLEEELKYVRHNYDKLRQSKFFRIATKFHRLMQFVGLRRSAPPVEVQSDSQTEKGWPTSDNDG